MISLGMEEEFFLVDPTTRDLVANPDPGILEECQNNAGPHKVVSEFLRSQIETNTRVCNSISELSTALRETRRLVVETAENHGLAVLAASTHPRAAWREQLPTAKDRYKRFAMTYQESVRRMLVCGMHIHTGFGDPDSRMRVMTALRRYMPLLHGLSASSPFSGGNETGFKSYRLTVVGLLPRTGIPGPLSSRAQLDELVAQYVKMEAIRDGSELWWDIRPSASFPTIELRICDICPRMDEAISIAALYASLIHRLSRLDEEGRLPEEPPTEIIEQNRWLAQRYGVLSFPGHPTDGKPSDFLNILTELVEDLTEDARALGCEEELRRSLTIAYEGSSADRQVDLYRLRILEGDTPDQALDAVIDHLLEESRTGV